MSKRYRACQHRMPHNSSFPCQSFQRYHGSSKVLDLCHEQIAEILHAEAEFCTVLCGMRQSIILMD